MTGLKKFDALLKRRITKRDPLPPAEWCKRHLHFNEAGNRAPFSAAGAEYVCDVLNDFGNATVTDEVLVWGSQTRKTGTLMGGMAWTVVNDPCGTLWVMPSLTLAQKFARQRWMKMLKSSPITEPYIPTGAERHNFATLTQMLGSSVFNFVGANSAANLASNPCRRVVCDEVDKFNEGGNKEADALNLAEQRTKGQVNAQRWKTSTPTLDTGLIWLEYLKGDQRRYFVHCPHCSKEILLIWSKEMTALPKYGCEATIKWNDDARTEDGWNLDQVAATAHMVCPHCQGKIVDSHKPAMIAKGIWRSTNAQAPSGFVSRQLSSLYSTMPECRFGALAVKFLQAKASLLGLQGFINGDLAEPYVDQDREAVRTERVSERYELNAKDGRPMMTVDHQQNAPHFWYVVRHWFSGGSTAVAAGSCNEWTELEDVQKKHCVANELVMIDSGYDSSEVMRRCAEHCSLRGEAFIGWMASKGFSYRSMWRERETGLSSPVQIVEEDPFKGTAFAYRGKLPVVHFIGDYFKDYLKRLRERKENGFDWSVASDVATDEYWRHLDGEIKERERNLKTGRVRYIWRPRSRNWPNHMFDCEVMQLVMAASMNIIPIGTKKETE
jgi:DNA-directed RNA polymerase subunit RPC12/RpoP